MGGLVQGSVLLARAASPRPRASGHICPFQVKVMKMAQMPPRHGATEAMAKSPATPQQPKAGRATWAACPVLCVRDAI